MADNYKIKIRAEIVKCADATTTAPYRKDVGAFEHVISVELFKHCQRFTINTTSSGAYFGGNFPKCF